MNYRLMVTRLIRRLFGLQNETTRCVLARMCLIKFLQGSNNIVVTTMRYDVFYYSYWFPELAGLTRMHGSSDVNDS